MQFALKGQDYSLSKQQLISHLQTPRTHSELDFDNRDQQEDATANKKLCDYSPNSQTFYKPVEAKFQKPLILKKQKKV